jgi:hypothetical protein
MSSEFSKTDRVQQALDNAAEKKREKLLRQGTRPRTPSMPTKRNDSDAVTKKKRRNAKSTTAPS